jgi:CRISPR-associated protein Cmr5
MSQQRSLEQQRASAAWDCVQGKKKEYCQAAKGAMADIQINGLGQALAFWNAKGKKNSEIHYKYLLDDVSKWVMGHLQPQAQSGLLEWVVQSASTDDYRRATSEAMAFLAWLKRFAEAEIKG